MVVQACCPNTQEAEAEELPGVQGQLGIHSEVKIILNYIVRPCPNLPLPLKAFRKPEMLIVFSSLFSQISKMRFPELVRYFLLPNSSTKVTSNRTKRRSQQLLRMHFTSPIKAPVYSE